MIIGHVKLADLIPTLRPIEDRLGREINPTVYPPEELAERGDSLARSSVGSSTARKSCSWVPPMILKDWLESRWITAHQVSPEEIADLLAVVDRDLVDAAVDGLSADWRLNIAYNRAPVGDARVGRVAIGLRRRVVDWPVRRHPDLLPDA